jgi:acetyltransferase-like isoleucine patch superfamily enzyme
VTIQTSSYITSNMTIEDNVFIGPCCSTSNDKYMGKGNYVHQGPIIRQGAKIGNNATLLPGITVGEDAMIGAGAVITRDVLPGCTVVGNPGKRLAGRKVDT